MRLRSLLQRLFRRRRRKETPWTLTPEEVQARFDSIRCAMPVDDEELAAAKPATRVVVR